MVQDGSDQKVQMKAWCTDRIRFPIWSLFLGGLGIAVLGWKYREISTELSAARRNSMMQKVEMMQMLNHIHVLEDKDDTIGANIAEAAAVEEE